MVYIRPYSLVLDAECSCISGLGFGQLILQYSSNPERVNGVLGYMHHECSPIYLTEDKSLYIVILYFYFFYVVHLAASRISLYHLVVFSFFLMQQPMADVWLYMLEVYMGKFPRSIPLTYTVNSVQFFSKNGDR